MSMLAALRPIWLALLIAVLCTVNLPIALATTPISSVSVSLRGQKYQVEDVTTVRELQDKVNALSGVAPSQQGRVIFGGQRLEGDMVLSEAGVPAEGAHVNMVPSTTAKASKKKKKATPAATSDTTASSDKSNDFMIDLFKQSGLDKDALDGMMKGLGGGDGAGMPANMEEGFKAMTEAMNSPLFQQMMGDPERLEQSRQMILNNPMLKSMMSGMPGMEDILNDPVAWRQAMQAAAELYKSMDTDTLMKAMMGGASDAAAANQGLLDGTLDSDSTATAALNELDEDD